MQPALGAGGTSPPHHQQLTTVLFEYIQRLSRADNSSIVFDYSWLVALFPSVIVLPAAFFIHQQPAWISNKYNKVLMLNLIFFANLTDISFSIDKRFGRPNR